jgi:hypothetical protein
VGSPDRPARARRAALRLPARPAPAQGERLILDIQRNAAEQQYYVYLDAAGTTGSWQPYVKNYAPNPTFDYGTRAAVLWLDR